MAYDFAVTDQRRGSFIDLDGITCSLDFELHKGLFDALYSVAGQFLRLHRFRDHSKDGFVGYESLGLLISPRRPAHTLRTPKAL